MCYDKRTNCFKLIIGKFSRIVFFVSRTGRLRSVIYKRLSVRGGYQWPRKQSEVRNLSWREFDWLMSGIDIDQPKALKAE